MPPVAPVTINGISWAAYERVLDKLTLNKATSVTDWVARLFTKESKKTKKITKRSYSGVPEAVAWPGDANGQPLPVATINDRFLIEAINAWYGQSVSYTLDMKTFDLHNLMSRMAGDLGNAVAVKRQKMALGFLSAGFSTVWNAQEGQYLFSAAHPLDERVGGTFSNYVNRALSRGALEDAIELMIGTPDDLGNPAGYTAKKLVVPQALIGAAHDAVGIKGMKPGTADNDPNWVSQYGITIEVCEWAQSDTEWYLYGQKHGLCWNDVISYKSLMDTDAKTQVTTHMAYFCSTVYAEDCRGVIGGRP
jgi:hypothetical protein